MRFLHGNEPVRCRQRFIHLHPSSSSSIDSSQATCEDQEEQSEVCHVNSFSVGMEDVVAAESAITKIDGSHGELWYRGYPIGELAERCSFEEVIYLLWH